MKIKTRKIAVLVITILIMAISVHATENVMKAPFGFTWGDSIRQTGIKPQTSKMVGTINMVLMDTPKEISFIDFCITGFVNKKGLQLVRGFSKDFSYDSTGKTAIDLFHRINALLIIKYKINPDTTLLSGYNSSTYDFFGDIKSGKTIAESEYKFDNGRIRLSITPKGYIELEYSTDDYTEAMVDHIIKLKTNENDYL